jgi:hypothetical protein
MRSQKSINKDWDKYLSKRICEANIPIGFTGEIHINMSFGDWRQTILEEMSQRQAMKSLLKKI